MREPGSRSQVESERLAFERLLKQLLGVYFENNMLDLVTGRILIEDNGYMLRIYHKGSKVYDIGIVY